MPTYKPCRVTFNGYRYQIEDDGTVRNISAYIEMEPNCGLTIADITRCQVIALIPSERHDVAKEVRQEAARQRRNRASRERNAAMRDLGMKRTPYGWE